MCLYCTEYCIYFGNYNTTLALLSGVTYHAVTRLRGTLEKLSSGYLNLIDELQTFLNPARNMQRYRQMLSARAARSLPIIPIVPIVNKDLITIHLANKTWSEEGLVNFDKMRLLSREIRKLVHYSAKSYVCISFKISIF